MGWIGHDFDVVTVFLLFNYTENGKKHSDKQVVIFECFAVFVCVAGIDVALENTVHDRLDKGVDAGYCVHGLQLLFFELFTGFYPGEQESATLYLWVGIFFRTVVPQAGEGIYSVLNSGLGSSPSGVNTGFLGCRQAG